VISVKTDKGSADKGASDVQEEHGNAQTRMPLRRHLPVRQWLHLRPLRCRVESDAAPAINESHCFGQATPARDPASAARQRAAKPPMPR